MVAATAPLSEVGALQKAPLGFLDRPAELSNQIYHLVLCPSTPIEVRDEDRYSGDTRYEKTTFHFPAPPLLQTSRQIRKEASDLYYSTATFSFSPSALYRLYKRVRPSFGSYSASFPPLRRVQVRVVDTVFAVDLDKASPQERVVIDHHHEFDCWYCGSNFDEYRRRWCAMTLEARLKGLRKTVETGVAARGGEGGVREEDLAEILRSGS